MPEGRYSLTEEMSDFYEPPKPKDYYVSKNTWTFQSVREESSKHKETDLEAMFSKVAIPWNKK